MLERGRFLTLVVLLRGRGSEGLRSDLRRTLSDFEEVHGDRLRVWDSAVGFAEPSLDALDDLLNPRVRI